MLMRTMMLAGVVWAGLAGCTSQTGPDSNVEVFETAEQAVAHRRDKLLVDWKDMAAKIANAERPDVRTAKAPTGFALLMSADGVEQAVDLTPLTEKLQGAVGKEREPIRAFLAEQFPVLDRARLKTLGFEKSRAILQVYLANTKQTTALTSRDMKLPPIINPVVIDLNWVPVVRWPTTGAQTAVDGEMAKAWGVTDAEVSAAAMANFRSSTGALNPAPIDTVELPGLGRYGSLRPGVDPAVVLLPEFVAAVRREWKTTDDLILMMPARTGVNIVERKNERLLARMGPEWAKLYGQVSEPLIGTMVLADGKGLSLYSAPTTTKPAAATAPATKPRVYIVH